MPIHRGPDAIDDEPQPLRLPTPELVRSAIHQAHDMRTWLRNAVNALESGELTPGDVLAFTMTISQASSAFDHARRRDERRVAGRRSDIMFATRPPPLGWYESILLDAEDQAPAAAVRESVERAERFVDLAEHIRSALAHPGLAAAERDAFEAVIAYPFDALQSAPGR
jgi:hypothetical protein